MLRAWFSFLLLLLAPTALAAGDAPRAVPTFESIGLYWSPGSDPGAAGCEVKFRKAGERDWRDGLPLWFDRRDGECRGSLVHLQPGTAYEVKVAAEAPIHAKTWNERFPVAKKVTLPAGVLTGTLSITQGGSASGYVLYEASPAGTTIDVADEHNHNVIIAASYVILRGVVLKGAKRDAIDLRKGAHDVVIEDNDISGWGRLKKTNDKGWQIGVDMDSGIRANCRHENKVERIIVQRNRIRDPRYGANSWSWGHPSGPQGITFSHCGGNHVIRHNEITSSDPQRYFNDAIGGEDNFTDAGFPHSDTDIYGNFIQGAWDEGIEAEGANRNVRIWGNYIDHAFIAIASTVTHHGPLYLFRNVFNRSRKLSERPADADDRGPMFKAGASPQFGHGRRYVFHNTALQAPPAEGARLPQGAGNGIAGNTNQPLTNTISRNNIFQVWKPGWESIREAGGSGNDFDHDLYNGKVPPGAQRNGVRDLPAYESGLALSGRGPGVDRGARIPNFNDDYKGAAPDIGAQEAGGAPMKFGRSGRPGSPESFARDSR